ncbi:hypothetical protein GL2_20960 [Microbulbifer sp. GL-2]|nr:hypothetical protein GL2_20960 [Microbulbifer sp. GL-2]
MAIIRAGKLNTSRLSSALSGCWEKWFASAGSDGATVAPDMIVSAAKHKSVRRRGMGTAKSAGEAKAVAALMVWIQFRALSTSY